MSAPSARRVVYLDVGSPATGTWPLRRLLDRNIEKLRHSGVTYAASGDLDGQVGEVRSPPGTSVISIDTPVSFDEHALGPALRSFGDAEVHVLLTAGEPVGELVDAWRVQVVEERLGTPWPVFAAAARETGQAAAEAVDRWAAGVSPDRVHVLTVPAGDDGTVLWRRFGAVLGLDPGLVDRTGWGIPALGFAQIELVRRVNDSLGRQLPVATHDRVVRRMLVEQVLAALPTGRGVPVSPQLAEWAANRSAETVKAIPRAGYDVAGDLEDLLLRFSGPVETHAAEELTCSELLEVAESAIVGCVRELRGLVPARAATDGGGRTGKPRTAARPLSRPVAHQPAGPTGSRQRTESTVFLHIGLAKTGTTHLQSTMSRNREQLRTDGFLYPGGRFSGHFFAALDVMQTPFRSHRYEQTAGAWDATARELLAWHGPGLISHEVLATASREAVQRIAESLPGVELHVVITARDLARQLPAVWQERLKVGHALTWATFIAAVKSTDAGGEPADPELARIGRVFWRGHNITEVATRWEAAVPADRIHVVTVPNVGSDPALLWRRFAATVGLDPDRYVTPERGVNASLGPAEAELLRRVNPALMDALTWEEYERHAKWDLAERVLASREQSGRTVLPATEWEWAAQRSERTLEELAERGYHLVGELDDLRPQRPVPSPRHRSPDQTDDSEVADVAIAAVSGLLSIAGRRVKPSQASTQTPASRLWADRLRDWRGHPRRARRVLGAVSGRVRSIAGIHARRALVDGRSEAGADVV